MAQRPYRRPATLPQRVARVSLSGWLCEGRAPNGLRGIGATRIPMDTRAAPRSRVIDSEILLDSFPFTVGASRSTSGANQTGRLTEAARSLRRRAGRFHSADPFEF